MHEPVITDYGLISSFGASAGNLWEGLCAKQTRIKPVTRFDVSGFAVKIAALAEDIPDKGDSRSLLFQLLDRLKPGMAGIPRHYPVFFATTKGEIDILEQNIEKGSTAGPTPAETLKKLKDLFGFSREPVHISAACASSTIAVAEGSRLISLGMAEGVIIIGADIITPFVFSGFSSLLAMDTVPAAPFDRNRKGLSVGEAASWMLITSMDSARKTGRKPLAKIAGWGSANDANHATGPSRTGEGLVSSVNTALKRAGISADMICAVCGHGTGTVFNDLMEITAFKTLFKNHIPPVFSVKGAMGHTMAACGMIEVILTIKALEEQKTPPTVNLKDIDPAMDGWVSPDSMEIRGSTALTTNSGFGGINSAIVLSLPENR